MEGQHAAVVHLVDVVAGDDEDVLGVVAAQEVHVLIHRVRRALVPLGLVDLLLGGQELDEFVEPPVQEAPAALNVADQAVGLVLGGHADAPDARIDAIGEGEINDAELAGEGHGGLGAVVSELLQSAAAAPGQDDGEGVAGELADEAHVGLFAHLAVRLVRALDVVRHGGPPSALVMSL